MSFVQKLFTNIVVVFIFCQSVSAFAMANISLVPSPDEKSYTLQAIGFENIGGIDVTITYDPNILTNPKPVAGAFVAGAMFMPNTNNPGTIRLGIISTKVLAGSGPIATISFERKAAGSGKVVISAKQLVKQDFTQAPVTSTNPNEQPPAVEEGGGSTGDSQPPANTDSGTPMASVQNQANTPTGSGTTVTGGQNQPYSSTGSGTYVTGGTITMPSESPAVEKRVEPIPEYKEPRQEAPVVAKDTYSEPEVKQSEDKSKPQYKLEPPKGVLAKFKEYKGEVNSTELMNLFVADEKTSVKQDPPIAFSDGKTTLKVYIPSGDGGKAPNFALKKAKLVKLSLSSDSKWVVEAKPDKGAYDVSVTMLLDDAAIEIPVTCAPNVDVDLDRSGKVDNNDFKVFLKDRGTEKQPKHDLNNDGARNYVDDYIFTANFIANQPKSKAKAAAPASVGKAENVKTKSEATSDKAKTKAK